MTISVNCVFWWILIACDEEKKCKLRWKSRLIWTQNFIPRLLFLFKMGDIVFQHLLQCHHAFMPEQPGPFFTLIFVWFCSCLWLSRLKTREVLMILYLPVFYLYIAPKKPTRQWSGWTHQEEESFITALRQSWEGTPYAYLF
jgi:hypothetical protein